MGYKEELQVRVAESKEKKDLALQAYDQSQTTENYETLLKAIKDHKKLDKELRGWS